MPHDTNTATKRQAITPPNAITASVMREDGGEAPSFCLMAAYRSEKDAMDAFALIAAAPAQQEAAYAALPEKYYLAGGEVPTWDAKQMHAFADATHALRASHGQASAGATPECLTCSDHGAVGNILTAEPCPDCTRMNAQQAVEREQERIAFKGAHRHLELYEVPDAWGRPMFKHSHVEASWLGWIARASHGQARADTVLYDPNAVLDVFHSARAGSEKPVGYLRGILAVIAHWESRPEPHRWMVPVLFTTPQSVAREPVAWLRNTTDPQPHAVTNLKYRSAVDAKAGVEYIPVFAAPQPVAREPLTPEQRTAAFIRAEKKMQSDVNLSWRHALVDEIEAAHGIKGASHDR